MTSLKGNIFEHVLYEFEMYLYSFSEMQRMLAMEERDMLRYNMAIDCHSVHMRNLLEFFNCDGNDCIDIHLILSGTHNYAISGEPYESLGVKQYVNKSVDHLTRQRFLWDGDAIKDLAERQKQIPIVMYRLYIPVRIKAFLKQLLDKTNIKSEWSIQCNDVTIQNNVTQLYDCLKTFPDVIF